MYILCLLQQNIFNKKTEINSVMISFLDNYPLLKIEWNYEKDGSPDKYTYGSHKKVSWICSKKDICECHIWKDTNQDAYNPVNKKLYSELYANTLEKERIIREKGYNLVVMWEHDFDI